MNSLAMNMQVSWAGVMRLAGQAEPLGNPGSHCRQRPVEMRGQAAALLGANGAS